MEGDGFIDRAIECLLELTKHEDPRIRLEAATELLRFGFSCSHGEEVDGEDWKNGAGPEELG
jgi:hypothetical protein